MAKFYAWSDLYNGGETSEIERFDGAKRTVIMSRNIIRRGEEVTKAKLKVSDEEWEALQESGSVRSYPVPENADDMISPTRAFLQAYTTPGGDVNLDAIMELGLANPPPMNPPASEGREIPVGA